MTARQGEEHKLIAVDKPGMRLDLWLGDHLDLSRSQIKRLIDSGLVTVNDAVVKAGYPVQEGDHISVTIPGAPAAELRPEPIPLDIVYEDSEVAVINKQKGLVVHPGAGNWDGTLVNALLAQVDELAEGSAPDRPGIVHRLDKDTSGLMMVAKTDEAYAFLSAQLKDRLVERHYLALVQGALSNPEGCIDKPIGRHPKNRQKMAVVPSGREAQTRYQVLEVFSKHSLVRCRLLTGRTHQIRVHFASIHHPLVGDPLYGSRHNNLGAKSQVLHACFLRFQHPKGGYLEFESSPDAEFQKIVEKARQMS
ncbi:MAG: RluA family pseudouridine synthase [Bacillota bacterium]|jgi:23S rRNA pseudouridine1911/1915/1917 synthase|nr:RluA family pseudouridine synthase [Bacillota bacterium]NLJ03778.1 RluA family pseudouridine synthase [Bacillota bacterium]